MNQIQWNFQKKYFLFAYPIKFIKFVDFVNR